MPVFPDKINCFNIHFKLTYNYYKKNKLKPRIIIK